MVRGDDSLGSVIHVPCVDPVCFAAPPSKTDRSSCKEWPQRCRRTYEHSLHVPINCGGGGYRPQSLCISPACKSRPIKTPEDSCAEALQHPSFTFMHPAVLHPHRHDPAVSSRFRF